MTCCGDMRGVRGGVGGFWLELGKGILVRSAQFGVASIKNIMDHFYPILHRNGGVSVSGWKVACFNKLPCVAIFHCSKFVVLKQAYIRYFYIC
jgi:hypothetical protein